MGPFFSLLGQGVVYTLMAAACLAGILLSALGFSGTWMVVATAAFAAWFEGPEFPHVGTVIAFAVVAAVVEGVEWMASVWGVSRRGGSRAAGFAAMGGGLLGTLLGQMILPIPLLGGLLGMLAGSFGLAYAVEWRRLRRHGRAASIATGVLVARLLVIVIKATVTLGLSLTLFAGIVFG